MMVQGATPRHSFVATGRVSVTRSVGVPIVKLARLLTNALPGHRVGYRNGDPLDLREGNLVVTAKRHAKPLKEPKPLKDPEMAARKRGLLRWWQQEQKRRARAPAQTGAVLPAAAAA